MKYFQCSCLNLHSKRVFRKAYLCVTSQCFYPFVWRRKVDVQWLTQLPSTVIPLETDGKCLPFRRFHQSGLYPFPLFFLGVTETWTSGIFQNIYFNTLQRRIHCSFLAIHLLWQIKKSVISKVRSKILLLYTVLIASFLIAACFYNCL